MFEPSPPRALVMGMGCGPDPETIDALRSIWRMSTRNCLWLSTPPWAPCAWSLEATIGLAQTIATPMPANSPDPRRRADAPLAPRLEAAARIAADLRIHLLVKGDPDLLVGFPGTNVCEYASSSRSNRLRGGRCPWRDGRQFARAGSGHSDAAQLASYWVGEAGDRAAGRRGFGLVATDVLEELPAALLDGLDRLRGAA